MDPLETLKKRLQPLSAHGADKLLARVRETRAQGGLIEAWLEGAERTILSWAPGKVDGRAPKELKSLLAATGDLALGEPGTVGGIHIHDGFSGTIHALGLDSGLYSHRDGFDYAETLCSPIDVGLSVFYVYHPKTGALHRFDQDGGLDKAAEKEPIGAVFMRLVLDDLSS